MISISKIFNKNRRRNREFLLHEQYIEDICISAIEKMEAKKLSSISVHAYVLHIPKRGYDESTEKLFRVSDNCLNKLYEYSKEMGFLQKYYSYEEFIMFHVLSPEDVNFLKNGGRIKRGLYCYSWDEKTNKIQTQK